MGEGAARRPRCGARNRVKRSLPLFFGVAAAIVAFDQWSKHWATERLAYQEPIHLLGQFVTLTYTRNPGIAFGLFAGHRFPFYVFSIIASLAVTGLFLRHDRMSLARQLSLTFILGGAIGNLIDRVTTGQVVDFILLSWGRFEFYVFNVADVFVTTGVALFAIAWTRDTEPQAPEASASVATEPAHAAHSGTDGPASGSEPASGSLAGEGADRPLA